MKAQLALIADSANLSQEGKLNVLGEFNTVYAPATPATYPLLWFVAKLEVGAADFGKHPVLLRLVDAEGNTVLTPLTGEMELEQPPDYSGDFGYVPVMLQVMNTSFPEYGTYTFELRIGHQIVAEAPIFVRERPVAGPA